MKTYTSSQAPSRITYVEAKYPQQWLSRNVLERALASVNENDFLIKSVREGQANPEPAADETVIAGS